MNANTIECPKCQTKIEVSKVMSAQITDRIREELQEEVDAEKATVAKEAEKVAKQKAANEKAAAELEQKVKTGIDAGVSAARATLVAAARKKAEEDLGLELREKAERVNELEGKLKTAQTTELSLRKRERELEEKAANLDLEVARKIKEETDRARDSAKKQAADEHALKDKETQEQNASLRRQVEDLRQKLAQGSQQSQGEALELVLEDLLSRSFPHDEIEEIGKGVSGGDWIQHVTEPSGLECGAIVWETKNAKNWSAAWLPKLRKDQRECKAVAAILVTEVMPPNCQHLTEIDGVWICTRACAMTLGAALRAGLVELAKARQASDGKHGKIERVYDYLNGPEFRQRVAGTVEPLVQMQASLTQERRAMKRIWAAREKQIEAAVISMHGMYGDLQGIVGANSLPTLEGMDLPELPGGESADDDAQD